MWDQKRVVKLGTSLVVIAAALYFTLRLNSNKDEQRKVKEPSKSATIKSIKNKKQDSISDQKKCNLLRELVINQVKEKSVSESWTNYYLEKGGINFVLRIEKDTNSQEIEIQRIKFYQLDEDDFPSPTTKFHDQVLKDTKQLKHIMQGYNLKEKNSVTMFENYLIEKENGKLKGITDQTSSNSCNYTSQE